MTASTTWRKQVHIARRFPAAMLLAFAGTLAAGALTGASASEDVDALEAACEAAREALIAPRREAEIRKCIADGSNDAEFCQRFFADYGSGGKVGGKVRVRLYDDLPECEAAREARREDTTR